MEHMSILGGRALLQCLTATKRRPILQAGLQRGWLHHGRWERTEVRAWRESTEGTALGTCELGVASIRLPDRQAAL